MFGWKEISHNHGILMRADDDDGIEMGREHSTEARPNNGGTVDNYVEGLPGIKEKLGLDHETNPQADNSMMQNNENVHLITTNNPQSPPHSPESVLDSVPLSNIPMELNRASDLLIAVSAGADANKAKINEIAVSAMEELIRKAFEGEPLWQRREDFDTEILNEAEYIREFRAFDASLKELMRMVEIEEPQSFTNLYGNMECGNGIQYKPLFPQNAEPDLLHTESSRQLGIVSMNATSIVKCLMDLNQWSLAFSNIVSSATILSVLTTGVAGSYDKTLQVMKAEFHMPTPLVPIRECQFARYCAQLGCRMWGVVDVSLESLFPYPLVRFRRRPSGCLIQEMPNGSSKVIWVEHVEVDNKFVHGIFRPLVLPGFAFSAMRWVTSLVRHCESVATFMSESAPLMDGALIPLNGKESLLKLAGRMMRSFYQNIIASTNNSWLSIPSDGAEDFRVMTKSIYALTGRPSATLVFTSSLRIQAPPKRVFDFLRHGDSRNKWDLLAHGYAIEEIMHILKGTSSENRVSIIQVNSAPNEIEILYLQESYSDPTGSYVVYAPIDTFAMSMVLTGGNSEYVHNLPSGFVIYPDKPVMNSEEASGSLLTLAFHVMDGSSTTQSISSHSVYTIQRILSETAILIKTALLSDAY